MSLINDALRRAKEADQQDPLPPSDALPFRPVEPAQQNARHGLGLLLPAALVVAALLGLLLVWAGVQTHHAATPTEVNARTARATPATSPAPAPTTPPTPVQEPVATKEADTSTAVASAADATSAPADKAVAATEEGTATNAAVVTPPAPPKPAPLRLQAIVYNPHRPSAMISGKTLFIGDKLGDMRVVAIDKDSATLVSVSQTNVLSLAE